MPLPWHLYLMALLYIAAGINHFRVPKMYVRIIPPYLPAPKALNVISGLAELLLGILLCIPATSPYAAWGLVVLLIVIFPANIYMYTSHTAGSRIPKWVLMLRLPLQAALIVWAWLYT